MLPPAHIAHHLRTSGWCHLPDLLPAELLAGLRDDLRAHRPQMTPAAVGRSSERQLLEEVRRDVTVWLTGATVIQRQLLEQMGALRFALNRELLLGLFDYEAHYAAYPPGGFYRRHVDAFRGSSNRVLSTVFYLNQDWTAADGGELVLWDTEDRELARILPTGGSALFFLSEEFPHEVLPAKRDRLSIAGWFRVNASRTDRPDPPR